MKALVILACLAFSSVHAGVGDRGEARERISEQKEQYEEGDSKKDYRCYGPQLESDEFGFSKEFPNTERSTKYSYVMAQDSISPIGGWLRYLEAIIQGEQNIGKQLKFLFMDDATIGDPAHVHFYVYATKTVTITNTGVNRWSFFEDVDHYTQLPPIADHTFVAIEWIDSENHFPIPYRRLDEGYHSGEDMETSTLLGDDFVEFRTPMVNKTFAYTTCIQLREIPTTTPPPTTPAPHINELKFPKSYTGMGCYGPNPVNAGNTNLYMDTPMSYIAVAGSAELPYGRLMSIEFHITNIQPFWITLYKQDTFTNSNKKFTVIKVWKHVPTKEGFDKIEIPDEVHILTYEDSRIGIAYDGPSPVPIPYDAVKDNFISYEKDEVVGTEEGEVVEWKASEIQRKAFRIRACVAIGGTSGTGGKGSNAAENIRFENDPCPASCPAGPPGPPGPPGPAGGSRKRRDVSENRINHEAEEVHESRNYFHTSHVVLAGFTWNVVITVLLASLAIYVVIQIHRLKAHFEAQARYYSPDELQVKS